MPGCESCFFKVDARAKVGSRGPEDSPFVIVGESPGIMEIHHQAPFVGDSGDVIEKTLQKVWGVSSADQYPVKPYFTNAISCLPRKRQDAKENQERLVQACITCRSRLLAELEKHPRKVILALGNAALWTLTGEFGYKITKERGKLFKSPLASVGIVAAVHPSFLLRGGGNYTQFEQDVRYATQLVEEGESAYKLPNGTTYRVLETVEEVDAVCEELSTLEKGTLIAADIETLGFNFQTDDILELGLQYHPKKSVIIPRHLMHSGIFSAGDHLNWSWHNGKFDIKHLRWHLKPNEPRTIRVDDDSMLLSYTLNERRGIHDQDQVASDWLGSPNHKQMVDPFVKGKIVDSITGRKRKRNYGDIPTDVRHRYLALDLSDAYHLNVKLKPMVMNDKHLRKFYTEHLIPGSEYLAKVEMNGMLVDEEWVDSNTERLKAECDKYQEQINEIAHNAGLGDINANSWQQLKVLLYDTLKLAPNSWGTDDDTLDKLPAHPVVKALKGHRKASKLLGTYVKPLIPEAKRTWFKSDKECVLYPDGRTHSTFMLHGTATSRLACNGPNVQNIPRDPYLRGQFKARPGYILLECDYSQAELRSLACLSRCPDLMEIFLSGKDLHVELSTFLFGENFTKEDKMKAKTVNFGIVYGRTAPSIAEAFDVSVDEAQSWIDGWFKRFPGAAEFISKCRMAPLLNQTMITCFGNKKRPGVVNPEKLNDYQNESANFPHQSIASNLTVRSGIELFDPLRDDYDTHIINTVHDCIVMETPANLEHIIKVANYVMDTMREIPKRYRDLDRVPFKAEAEIGWHWGNLVKLADVEKDFGGNLNAIPQYIAPH